MCLRSIGVMSSLVQLSWRCPRSRVSPLVEKGRRRDGGEMAGERSRPAAFKAKAAASGSYFLRILARYSTQDRTVEALRVGVVPVRPYTLAMILAISLFSIEIPFAAAAIASAK